MTSGAPTLGGLRRFAQVVLKSLLVTGTSTFTGAVTASGGLSGNINGTVGATTPASGSFTTVSASGDITMGTAAKTLVLKQGSNGKTGTVTLNGATPVTVSNTSITANSGVVFTLKTVGGTVGAVPSIKTITAGTGFTVAGTASDTSVYNYHVIESAA